MVRAMSILFLFVAFLSSSSTFAGSSGLALVGPNGDVAFFYSAGDHVEVKQCVPNSQVNPSFDCAKKENTRVTKVSAAEISTAFRFLAKLNLNDYTDEMRRKLELYARGKLLDGEKLERSRAEVREELQRIEDFIAAHGSENADLKRKASLEGELARLNQLIEDNTEASLSAATREVNTRVDNLIALFTSSNGFTKVTYSEQKNSFEFNILKSFVKSADLVASFVPVAPGTFMMGSPPSEIGRGEDELLHRVTLTRAFEIQATEVTQGQYALVMGKNPSRVVASMWCPNNFAVGTVLGAICPNNPVEMVSWDDAQEFIAKLNAANDGYEYRLPTEAEWEYAARAGTKTAYYFGGESAKLRDYSWFLDNSGNISRAVANKQPNSLGLYDMYGNVAEWVQDWYGPYSAADAVNPAGPGFNVSKIRLVRGGGSQSVAQYQRSATRIFLPFDKKMDVVGFRLVRVRK